MWELTKRISSRISFVLSKVEPELDLYTGSDQKVRAPTPQHWGWQCHFVKVLETLLFEFWKNMLLEKHTFVTVVGTGYTTKYSTSLDPTEDTIL